MSGTSKPYSSESIVHSNGTRSAAASEHEFLSSYFVLPAMVGWASGLSSVATSEAGLTCL